MVTSMWKINVESWETADFLCLTNWYNKLIMSYITNVFFFLKKPKFLEAFLAMLLILRFVIFMLRRTQIVKAVRICFIVPSYIKLDTRINISGAFTSNRKNYKTLSNKLQKNIETWMTNHDNYEFGKVVDMRLER